jgi:hypothetical protein
MLAGKSIQSNPAGLAVEGDERIRTAVPWLSTDSTYVRRSVCVLACAVLACVLAPWAVLACADLWLARWAWRCWA